MKKKERTRQQQQRLLLRNTHTRRRRSHRSWRSPIWRPCRSHADSRAAWDGTSTSHTRHLGKDRTAGCFRPPVVCMLPRGSFLGKLSGKKRTHAWLLFGSVGNILWAKTPNTTSIHMHIREYCAELRIIMPFFLFTFLLNILTQRHRLRKTAR